ncbi:MAG TPA: hypothetical protein VF082_12705 [Jiangellaceae bacterium]
MDKAVLLKRRLREDKVEIHGVGVVMVRGLSRGEADEVVAAREAHGVLAMERKILAFGMVDPALDEDEVAQWQRAAGTDELNAVIERISELSGMDEGAAKSGVPGDGDRPGN